MLRDNFILFMVILFFSQIPNAYSENKFLSLKKNKVNVRYGPSFEFPVKFIYKKINLPIKQIDKKENFRRIIDFKNNSGWIHVSQLKKNISVIATQNKVLFKKPSSFAKPIAQIEKGRLLIVHKCQEKWCKIKSGDYQGWIKTDDIWGLIN